MSLMQITNDQPSPTSQVLCEPECSPTLAGHTSNPNASFAVAVAVTGVLLGSPMGTGSDHCSTTMPCKTNEPSSITYAVPTLPPFDGTRKEPDDRAKPGYGACGGALSRRRER